MKTKMVALIAVVMMMASAAWAAGDTSALHPPAGSRMALVVFEDLQCPACAKAEPTAGTGGAQLPHTAGAP